MRQGNRIVVLVVVAAVLSSCASETIFCGASAPQSSTPTGHDDAGSLAGDYGGHGRGLTIRADGTGTGWFTSVCGPDGGGCVANVYYDVVVENIQAKAADASADLAIIAARPDRARAMLPQRQRIVRDPTKDEIIVGGVTFCGPRAAPFACGA